jgi:TatD DNase family protein
MIDSHCHLDFVQFDGRRDLMIRDAAEAGVHTIINIGIDGETSSKSIALAERFDNMYATIGFHPHEARLVTDDSIGELRQLAAHPKVRAIGETGLDYYRDRSPRNVQRQVFSRQLKLAVELSLPVVIHTREAYADTVAMVREFASELPGGVFHCFPGNEAEAEEVIALGFVISVGGVITFPKALMAGVATATPLSSIILETDAPFLAPVPYRGKTNCPAHVSHVYRKLAELKQIPLEEVEKTVDRTCQKLFGLVETFGG